MVTGIPKWFGLMAGFMLVLAFPAISLAAKTYTVTIPNNTTCGPTPAAQLCVTMGDENFVILPHRITHTGDTNEIKVLTFNLPAGSDYNFNSAVTAPTGWYVKSFSALSVEFSVTAGGTGLDPDKFLDFYLVVTGANDEAIPAAASDLTETALSSVSVSTEGGFSMQGALPQWTRKSLAILLIATPTTTGVGGTIGVEMQVTNRSSVTQNGIGSSPDPPTRIYTDGASVSLQTGPINNPNPFNLASGETGTVIWTFQADATGTVTFEAFAFNGSPATSIIVRSATVVIGDFTAAISMDSTSAVSGQSIQVTLTVTNNGSTALFNTTLTLTPQGTTSIVCDSGPSQNLGTLVGNGASVAFIWNCTVTGSVDDTFLFFGQGQADGTVTTNMAITPTGSISAYSANVTPTVIPSNSAPKTFSWTVYNQGNQVVKEVRIEIPNACNPACNGWGYSSADAGGANWSLAPSGNPVNLVTFTSNNPVNSNGIPIGGSRTFSITFTSVPTVTSDTPYNFPVTIVDKNNVEVAINTTITVTGYSLTLSANPVSIVGDGSSTSTITATLAGPSPGGKTITFITTSGTLSSSTAITDVGGVATVTLTSSQVCGGAPLAVTVTGSYGTANGTVNVTFTAIGTAGNISYVGSFEFERTNPNPGTISTPISIDPGDQGYFRMNVQNTGCGDSVRIFINGNDVDPGAPVVPSESSLTVGSTVYPLESINGGGDTTLNVNDTVTLLFGNMASPAPICSGSGTYTPTLIIDGQGPAGGPRYAEAFAAPGDPFSDTVTVTGAGTPCSVNIQIYDWRDVR